MMPSATGVRIAGDGYQWLHAWRICMELLHDRSSGQSANPSIAVGIEEPGVGAGDDIVRYRANPPHSYMQVKYAVDDRDAVGLDYLESSEVLRKLVAAHRGLSGTAPVEMRLVTNRLPDRDDILMRDRDARDARLVPRCAAGGPRSQRAEARARWASAAGTDEPELLRFLEDFYLDVGYGIDRLREEIALRMAVNGLRSDDGAVTAGASWIAERAIAGQRRLDADDIEHAAERLGLRSGEPWCAVSIATVDHDPFADQAAASVDWVDRMKGDSSWTRVEPLPPATWAELAEEIDGLRAAIGSCRRVLVAGRYRQATGFLTGTVFRRVLGYSLAVRQGSQTWTADTQPAQALIDHRRLDIGRGDDLVVVVNVAADATPDVVDWVRASDLRVGSVMAISPVSGTPHVVDSPEAAHGLAIAIRDLVRAQAPHDADVHLFLAGPVGLAVLMGHLWNRVRRTHVYEHVGTQAYVRAFSVQA